MNSNIIKLIKNVLFWSWICKSRVDGFRDLTFLRQQESEQNEQQLTADLTKKQMIPAGPFSKIYLSFKNWKTHFFVIVC